MTRLISYGDHLEKGQYKVHSRFTKAVNFISGDHLTAVVNPSVGGGPFNVVIDGAVLKNLSHLAITDDFFFLNDEKIPKDESKKYFSEIDLNGFDDKFFKGNLNYLEEILIQRAQEKSLVFLLDPVRRLHFKTSFEKELLSRFNSSMNYFNSSDIIGAVRMMKGAGFGLTPSGDDFIAGFLQGLNVQQKFFKADYGNLIRMISEETRSDNIITGTLLTASAWGWLNEHFKELIQSLFNDSKIRIDECTNRVLSHGATSGADWCVGFMFGLKKR